jgi:hypothetical protein
MPVVRSAITTNGLISSKMDWTVAVRMYCTAASPPRMPVAIP